MSSDDQLKKLEDLLAEINASEDEESEEDASQHEYQDDSIEMVRSPKPVDSGTSSVYEEENEDVSEAEPKSEPKNESGSDGRPQSNREPVAIQLEETEEVEHTSPGEEPFVSLGLTSSKTGKAQESSIHEDSNAVGKSKKTQDISSSPLSISAKETAYSESPSKESTSIENNKPEIVSSAHVATTASTSSESPTSAPAPHQSTLSAAEKKKQKKARQKQRAKANKANSEPSSTPQTPEVPDTPEFSAPEIPTPESPENRDIGSHLPSGADIKTSRSVEEPTETITEPNAKDPQPSNHGDSTNLSSIDVQSDTNTKLRSFDSTAAAWEPESEGDEDRNTNQPAPKIGPLIAAGIRNRSLGRGPSADESHIVTPENKALEAEEVDFVEPTVEDSEDNDRVVKEREIVESLRSEANKPLVDDFDFEGTEVTESTVKKSELHNSEVSKPEVTKPEVTKPEVTKPEVTKPEVTKSEVTKPEVNKPEVNKPEVNKPEVNKPELNKSDVREFSIDDSNTDEFKANEPELNNAKVNEYEAKEPNVNESKASESSKPKVKESEVDVSPVKDSELRKSEANESKANAPPFKESELSESKLSTSEVKESKLSEPDVSKSTTEELEANNSKVNESKARELKVKSEGKVSDFRTPEFKESNLEKPVSETPLLEKPESDKPESLERKCELGEPEVHIPEPHELEINESLVKNPEAEKSEAKESEIRESDIRESEIKESDIKESEIKESEIKESEIKEPEVDETQDKEPGRKKLAAIPAESKRHDAEKSVSKSNSVETSKSEDTEAEKSERKDPEGENARALSKSASNPSKETPEQENSTGARLDTTEAAKKDQVAEVIEDPSKVVNTDIATVKADSSSSESLKESEKLVDDKSDSAKPVLENTKDLTKEGSSPAGESSNPTSPASPTLRENSATTKIKPNSPTVNVDASSAPEPVDQDNKYLHDDTKTVLEGSKAASGSNNTLLGKQIDSDKSFCEVEEKEQAGLKEHVAQESSETKQKDETEDPNKLQHESVINEDGIVTSTGNQEPARKVSLPSSEDNSTNQTEKQPEGDANTVYLYVSLASGQRGTMGRYNKATTILKSYDIEFVPVEITLDERAKRLWKLKGVPKNKLLPAIFRDGDMKCDFNELVEANEIEDVEDVIFDGL